MDVMTLAEQELAAADRIHNNNTYYGDRYGDAAYHLNRAQTLAALAQADALRRIAAALEAAGGKPPAA